MIWSQQAMQNKALNFKYTPLSHLGPEYPGLQVQLYAPGVFMQKALGPQSTPFAHSSISLRIKLRIMNDEQW